ncbi:tetratricopeptide repeat protein [Deferrisoma camini]|uniref:tetratricopeptide repeat protein n=1 Tax=Deferrisoma camini TaxID=1035120 RepID=UPI00046CC453|nr:tetratricopeptide repeat protein [Deferrisoma camini]
MWLRRIATLVTVLMVAAGAAAADIPRSARLVKEAGNQFLAAKRYADAIDCYLQALEIVPEYPEAHYNLGVAFLKGFRAFRLARHHFERYLDLEPLAPDREAVEALVATLARKESPLPGEPGQVVAVVGGRLLVSGGGWVRKGDEIEIREQTGTPCARVLADYVYPDCVLTQRILDDDTLQRIQPGLVAVNR